MLSASTVATRVAFLSVMLFLVCSASALATPYNALLSRGRTEPSVALDPTHPSTIVVGTNPNYDAPVAGTLPDGVFTSHDAGKSFRSASVPLIPPYTVAADPSVVIDHHGTVFYGMLGETPAYCTSGHSAVLVTRSVDGGYAFRMPTVVDVNSADDKPYIAVESRPSGPSQVMVSWTRFIGKRSEIWFARSSNGGVSFGPAVKLYGSSNDNFGSLPVVATGRRVYVFWSSFPDRALHATSPAHILMRASADDGVHFGPVRDVIGTFRTIPQMMEPGSLRSLTAPTVSIGRRGSVYLAWAAVRRDRGHGVVDVNVLISQSLDHGAHWSPGQVVNDSQRGDRFMPSISALPDGSIGVAFYDRRLGGSTLSVYFARVSFDGGFHRTANVQVNGGSSPIDDLHYIAPGSTCLASGRFFGDYIGTAPTQDNSLCVVWTDTQFHVPGETDIWLARVYSPKVRPASRALLGRREIGGRGDYSVDRQSL